MRIFWALVILIASAFLWLIPITDLVYTFQTDVRTDSAYIATGVGETTGNMTLHKALYDDDTSTISVFSDLETDALTLVSYNTTTRVTAFSGFTANSTRTIEVTYDTDALNASSAWETVLDKIPLIWMIMVALFPVAGLAAIFTGRA